MILFSKPRTGGLVIEKKVYRMERLTLNQFIAIHCFYKPSLGKSLKNKKAMR